jgi:hypothetical protein
MSDMAATKAIGQKRAMIQKLYQVELEAAAIREKLETGGSVDEVLDRMVDLGSTVRTIDAIGIRWEAFTEVANA